MTKKGNLTKSTSSKFLCLADVTLDVGKRQATGCNGTKGLTTKECQLLALLMSNPGRVLRRKFLMKKVWETDYLGDTRTLDVHICWLRKKIEKDPHSPQYITTVRRVSYCFQAEE